MPIPLRKDTLATFNGENAGRPVVQVWGSRGMASSMHPLASAVALDILRAGGNAIDAAVALGAVMSVLSPEWSGPAGDSAWLVYLADSGRFHYLDGYCTCPAAIRPELLQHRFALDRLRHPRAFDEEPPECRHVGVVTGMVPGTPAAWAELAQRFGRLGLERLFQSAIRIADEGFSLNEYLSLALRAHEQKIGYESSRRVLCDGTGSVLGEGSRLRQPDLANTLRAIAERGHAGFYSGPTADMIVGYCHGHGGTITHDDLKGYRAVWRDVVAGSYRGTEVVVTTPPTAGIHVLQALQILEGFDLAVLPYHGPQSLHLVIEAVKLALADRRSAGGDPDYWPMDLAMHAGKEYANRLRSTIDPGRATPGAGGDYPGNSTTHFCVVDEAGNMVSATQTIGSAFGCGEVIAGTGLLLNDRTWWMSLDAGSNQVAPLHRANIGHAPTMLVENGRPYAAFGSPGGFGIVQYVVQVIVNMLDYGLDIQRAIEAPRFKLEDLQGEVGMEQRFSPATKEALVARGHQVVDYPPWTDRVGGVEGVFVDVKTGSMLGGYDPRRNSLAAGMD